MLTVIIVGVVSFLAGAGLVVVFSKNNKNTISSIRAEILSAVARGEDAVKQVLDRNNV